MSSTSSFSALTTDPADASPGWRERITGALDGTAFGIPLSLGSAALVFSHVGAGTLASGVFAVMLALVWVHLACAPGSRPVFYAARFFEATTLAAMIDQVAVQLPSWHLPDTPGVRLAMLCLLGGTAGVWVGGLYLLRIDRFTRYIPAPVFAGFANSIAVALFVSQARALGALVDSQQAMVPTLSIAALVIATGLAVRRWRPRWPAASAGLAVGLAAGLAWLATGFHAPVVSTGNLSTPLPFMLADFTALSRPGVALWAIAAFVAVNSAILGTMVFINTTLTSQLMTHLDERRRVNSVGSAVSTAAVLALAGAIGSVPISGSTQSSAAVTRTTRLTGTVMALLAAATAAVYLAGLLAWIPLAALCGALICEGWVMIDRNSVRLLRDWARGRVLAHNAREDLALVAAVTTSAVFFNMVVAILVGLVLGLLLFAVRNARKPVRYVWTGSQVNSNCARSRAELRLLTEHGAEVKVFELEGDLFFGVVEQLEMELRRGLEGTTCAIIDWSRVRHIDSSIAPSVAKLEKYARSHGVMMLHAGADMQAGNVAPVLFQQMPDARFVPDLDRALEQAENHLIKLHGTTAPPEITSMLEAVSLFHGLTDDERARIEALMEQRVIRAGEPIVVAGDPGNELMLVLYGSASVIIRSNDGRDIRVAGLRRGATIGEIGFLDHSPRSATVVAQDDVAIAVLTLQAYESLCESDPHLVRRLLSNIAIDVATRLRHTNKLAIARTRTL